jgi:hypothetical protein
MKKHKVFFIGTVELCLHGYIYNQSWIIEAEDKGNAEILMEQYVECLYYKCQTYEYSTCAVFEIEEEHFNEVKQFLPLLPCKSN